MFCQGRRNPACEAPLGRGTRGTEGRIFAGKGLMEECEPRFGERVSAIKNGGVLAALPALLKEGLLSSGGGGSVFPMDITE